LGFKWEFEELFGGKMIKRAEEEEASVFDRYSFFFFFVTARLLPWFNLLSHLFVILLRMSSYKLFIRTVWRAVADCFAEIWMTPNLPLWVLFGHRSIKDLFVYAFG